jgi:N-acylglucosamine-6-phosphate 2-epimerase
MALPDEVKRQLVSLAGGLVVSCQAGQDSPLHGAASMAAMAAAAVAGGAGGIRANGPADIAAIRERVTVPILGINKLKASDGSIFITPNRQSVREVIAAGARLVALDGTARSRESGEALSEVIDSIHGAGAAALADISTLEEALEAAALGADMVGTTLSGYTSYSPQQEEPDFALLEQLRRHSSVSFFAEGRIWTGEQARRALALGAAFVVIGTAITNPQAIAQRFVQAMKVADQPTSSQ